MMMVSSKRWLTMVKHGEGLPLLTMVKHGEGLAQSCLY
jgi:hypothetical protein